MALSVLRGVKFYKVEEDGYIVEYCTVQDDLFCQALDDVAKALGYVDRLEYNRVCEADPNEIRRRIRAL